MTPPSHPRSLSWSLRVAPGPPRPRWPRPMGRPRRPAPPPLLTPKFPARCADRLQGSLAPSPVRPRPRPVPAVRARPAVHLAVFRIGTPLLLLGEPEPESPRKLVPGGPGARAEAAVLAQLRGLGWVPSDSATRAMPAGTPLATGAR